VSQNDVTRLLHRSGVAHKAEVPNLSYAVYSAVRGSYPVSGPLVQNLFLGAFAKLRKTTTSFMSVCLKQLGPHWTDFDETLYLSFIRRSVEEIQVFYMKTFRHF
jgi:hypothetical protein